MELRRRGRGGAGECAWGLLTLGSPGTGAFVGIDQVNAGAPVLARLGETFIDLVGAVGPHISWHALKKKRDGTRKRRTAQKEEEEEDEGEEEGEEREKGKVESMADMKRLGFCFFFVYLAVFLACTLPRPADPSFQRRLA